MIILDPQKRRLSLIGIDGDRDHTEQWTVFDETHLKTTITGAWISLANPNRGLARKLNALGLLDKDKKPFVELTIEEYKQEACTIL